MGQTFLKNQNIPTKPCPRCNVGTIYTGERAKSLNVKIDGQAVCEDCMVKHLINRYHNKDEG
jgi:hypothetical protein